MTVSIIVAAGLKGEIGCNGGLLCHLPADLAHFKTLTTGHAVIMGRRTFDSLPKGPLPCRRNVVISRNPDLQIPGAEVAASLDAALVRLRDESEVFIIGGGQIYKQAVGFADKLYLTRIHARFPDADVFFPEIDTSQWRIVDRQTFAANEKNAFAFSFLEYERIF
jgi:dihydrofolate reductase